MAFAPKCGLLSVIFTLCLVCATNGDKEECKDKETPKIPKCFDKLNEGLKCDGGESAVEKCLKECATEPGKSYLKDYVKQYDAFEQAICDTKENADVKNKAVCIENLFINCKNAYNKNWDNKTVCEDGKKHIEDCRKTVLDQKACEDKFVNKINDLFITKCPGNDATHFRVTSWSLIPALLVIVFTKNVV